jgi:hypothetical protein
MPHLLLLNWVAAFVLFFSFGATKLPNYVAPVMPALALTLGSCLVQRQRAPSLKAVRWFRMEAAALAVVGVGFAILTVDAAGRVFPGDASLGWIGGLPVLGGVAALRASRTGQLRRASQSVALACVAFITALMGFATVRVGEYQDGRQLVAEARRRCGGHCPVLLAYGVTAPSVVYYSGGKVGYLHSSEQVQEACAQSPAAFLITRERLLSSLKGALPADMDVSFRCRDFLRGDNLVLMSRASHRAAAGSPTTAR